MVASTRRPPTSGESDRSGAQDVAFAESRIRGETIAAEETRAWELVGACGCHVSAKREGDQCQIFQLFSAFFS